MDNSHFLISRARLSGHGSQSGPTARMNLPSLPFISTAHGGGFLAESGGVSPNVGLGKVGQTPAWSPNGLGGYNGVLSVRGSVSNNSVRMSGTDLGLSPVDTKQGQTPTLWTRSPTVPNIANVHIPPAVSIVSTSNMYAAAASPFGHLMTAQMSVNTPFGISSANSGGNGNNSSGSNSSNSSGNGTVASNSTNSSMNNNTVNPLLIASQNATNNNHVVQRGPPHNIAVKTRKRPASSMLERPSYMNGYVSQPSPTPAVQLGGPPAKTTPEHDLDDILHRVKDILVRDRVKQKQLALDLGFSGSTLSPILKCKYKHIKLEHMQNLYDWSRKRDAAFVKKCLARQEYFGFSREDVCRHLAVTPAQFSEWVALEGTPADRHNIDTRIEQIFNTEMMDRLTLQHVLKDNPEQLSEEVLLQRRVQLINTTCQDTRQLVLNTFPSLAPSLLPMVVSSIGDINVYTTQK